MIRSPTVKKMLVAMEKWDAGNCLSDTLPKKWWEVVKTWKGSRAAGILQRYKSSIVFSYYGAFVCMQDTFARTRSRLKAKQPPGMMINHSTLEYHVTNFNTFFRWLWRKNQNPNTLL